MEMRVTNYARVRKEKPDATADFMRTVAQAVAEDLDPPIQAAPNHSHAWRGTWNRPMKLDENREHPFTIARMTDHNVRGCDK